MKSRTRVSYACLATRVPAGTPLTAAGLARVERGESALMALGLSDFRLRLRRRRCGQPGEQGPLAVVAAVRRVGRDLRQGQHVHLQHRQLIIPDNATHATSIGAALSICDGGAPRTR